MYISCNHIEFVYIFLFDLYFMYIFSLRRYSFDVYYIYTYIYIHINKICVHIPFEIYFVIHSTRSIPHACNTSSKHFKIMYVDAMRHKENSFNVRHATRRLHFVESLPMKSLSRSRSRGIYFSNASTLINDETTLIQS